LRVFEDDHEKMTGACKMWGAVVLAVSQVTLYGTCDGQKAVIRRSSAHGKSAPVVMNIFVERIRASGTALRNRALSGK